MEECLKFFPYDGMVHRASSVEEGPKCICTLQSGHKGSHRCPCGHTWDDMEVPLIPPSQDKLLASMLYQVETDMEVRELLLLIRMVWGQMPHAICEQAKKVEDILG